MNLFKKIPAQIWLLLISLLLFIPFLGQVPLFDWDEINFAESAREMIVTGNYFQVQIDYQPFWEKPPLFIWFQVLSMKIFGINEFAARLPNAICGILTLQILYLIGKRLHESSLGVIWALVYCASLLPHFYFKSGLMDPWFNFFTFLAIFHITRLGIQNDFIQKKRALSMKSAHAAAAGIFIGLAVLVKGPVAAGLMGLTAVVYFFISGFKKVIRIRHGIVGLLWFSIVILLWYGVEVYIHGWWFIETFIEYQLRLASTEDAGHGGFLLYHFVVLLLGCFPASLLLFGSFSNRKDLNESTRSFQLWMVALLSVVLVVFTIVQTKILHYSSLAYYPITFLAALYLNELWARRAKWNKVIGSGLVFFVLLFAVVIAAVPLVGANVDDIIPLIDDPFAVANLSADVYWAKWELAYAVIFLAIGVRALFFLWRGQMGKGIMALLISGTWLVVVIANLYVPRIEKYTQGAAIEFYEAHQNSEIKLEVIGFKSYAHLFYGQKMPDAEYEKTYYVTRLDKLEKVLQEKELIEIYRKNGFIFLKEGTP